MTNYKVEVRFHDNDEVQTVTVEAANKNEAEELVWDQLMDQGVSELEATEA